MADLYSHPGREPLIFIEDGKVRVLSFDRSTELISYLEYPGRLTEKQQQHLCGALLHRRFIDQPIHPSEYAELIKPTDVPVNRIPDKRIIKMLKAHHADALLSLGALRLGSIDYYRRFDDTEIGDPTEGNCILSAFDGLKTVIAEVRGGLNDLLFCTYQGEIDPELIRKMGYDAAIEITDVKAFSAEIAGALRSRSSKFSSCVYVRDRAIYGDTASVVDRQDFMDGPISEMLGDARAFLKPKNYSHQNEFRFSWTVSNRGADFLDIECSSIRSYVRAVAL